jgi:outer membrane protein assembly factor BamD
MTKTKILLVIILISILSGCVSKKEASTTALKAENAEAAYEDGMQYFTTRQYSKAAEKFALIALEHPFSALAPKAQFMEAYTNYRKHDYDTALAIIDTFTRLHVSYPEMDRVYYVRALCYYEQISGSERDNNIVNKARESLQELISKFPHSEYVNDAKLKLDLTYDFMAAAEMDIGRFYLGRKEYIAALNRFKTVVEQYQTTTHTIEALHRMVELSSALGLKDEAKKYALILGNNYPSSVWYKQTYELMKGYANIPVYK